MQRECSNYFIISQNELALWTGINCVSDLVSRIYIWTHWSWMGINIKFLRFNIETMATQVSSIGYLETAFDMLLSSVIWHHFYFSVEKMPGLPPLIILCWSTKWVILSLFKVLRMLFSQMCNVDLTRMKGTRLLISCFKRNRKFM